MIRMMLVAVAWLAATAVLGAPPPKPGPCPSDYWRSGSYCVPIGSRGPTAMPKAAEPCPSGYRLKGRACVRIK